MKDEEIRENIKFEMQEYFSIDPEKYSVTYKILKRDENEGRAVLRVLGVAAPLDLLAGYVRTLKKAGLKLQYIDISINAYLKVFKLLTETEALALSKGVCLLDYGYSTLTMSVFDGGIPFVTRALDKTWQDDNIDEVAARLNQVLDYYYSRNYTSRIEKVWVVGGNSIADDFCPYLSLQTGSEVKPLAPEMLNIRYCDGQTAIPIALYAKSIGAAIREDVRK
jgi:type IV pilus assembly protein PilM